MSIGQIKKIPIMMRLSYYTICGAVVDGDHIARADDDDDACVCRMNPLILLCIHVDFPPLTRT